MQSQRAKVCTKFTLSLRELLAYKQFSVHVSVNQIYYYCIYENLLIIHLILFFRGPNKCFVSIVCCIVKLNQHRKYGKLIDSLIYFFKWLFGSRSQIISHFLLMSCTNFQRFFLSSEGTLHGINMCQNYTNP